MLAETTFVTTRQGEDVLAKTRTFLERVGFKLRSSAAGEVYAVRGRIRATSRKVSKLPQRVKVRFDRGRVTIAASIVAHGRKEKSIHSSLMTALVEKLHHVLTDEIDCEQACEEWCQIDAASGSMWTVMDVVGVLLVSVLVALVGIVVLALLLMAITSLFD